MTVRQASAADLPRVVEMCSRFLSSTSYLAVLGPVTPKTIAELVAFTMRMGAVFVGEAEPIDSAKTPVIVGFIGLVQLAHPFTKEPYADELAWWVEPEYRAGLVGPRLLGAAEEWARQEGLTVLKLVAPSDSPSVGKFLAKRRFTAVETTYYKRL